ncbi:NAD-dependent epimerase/dehydratase family protein [Paenibacillus puerhi]|uniref:NAD-dependent epimerase/dehydratase family protein n=1 Tax=Paenibacillus puerhi TaxID=2692622 RepID=UPI00135A571B|nr:NAD-dependent epimerase/dehydratase family protein [Paenibacillus puerhi]
MKIFITGITGYIGSVAAQHFLSQGHEVIGLVRTEEQAEELRKLGYTPLIGDLGNHLVLREGAEAADGVFHAAISHTPDCEQLDVWAVRTMLDALSGTGKAFLYTSGTLIYNDTGELAVHEESPLDPLPFLQWKADQEQVVLAAAERNIRTVVVRPSLVYGRGGGLVSGMLRIARHLKAAYYIGEGNQAWSTIHVEDLAELLGKALRLSEPGTLLNASSREAVTMKQLAAAVGGIIGYPDSTTSWTLEEAGQWMGPAAWAGSISQRISGLKAERLLAWSAQAPSLLDELSRGSYRSG